jgi:ComF family protein
LESREKVVASGAIFDLVSLFVFEKEGAFQHLVHALKYQGFQKVGRDLGEQLGQRVVELGIEADLLIPVPLHRRKLRERGYNQAEAIARGMQTVMKCELRTDILQRTRFTVSQTTLALEERKKNMEDAFDVISSRRAVVKGKSVIIVDDVLTTGSTIISCATALKKAGAERAIAAAVALAE